MPRYIVESESLEDLLSGIFSVVDGVDAEFNPCGDCQNFDCYGCKFATHRLNIIK